METKKSKRFLMTLVALYWALVVMIYAIANEQFHYLAVSSDTFSPSYLVGEIVDGDVLRQKITIPVDNVDSCELMVTAYNSVIMGQMNLRIQDNEEKIIALSNIDFSEIKEGKYTRFQFDKPIEGRQGESMTLIITTVGCSPGNAVAFYAGNTVTAGRYDIAKSIAEEDCCNLNGVYGIGGLCVKLNGQEKITFYKTYWAIVVCTFIALSGACLHWWHLGLKGKNNILVMLCTLVTKYGFLLRQLVARDFKTKYKRSLLGMAWSFLNPLLIMAVQYVVFSTLFQSSIENYRIFLLTGIVFFNFFNEATGMCMTSITGNASLIKKVYMPKYIYPLSRIVSSLINFSLALIPLFLVMLLTGTPFRPSLLLLIFCILCQLGFTIGMGLLLTTSMTFFQDTQFLWGVLCMIWMYLTPIFYPESIIPQNMLTFYHMNPLYQYITFARICIIDGVSPAPTAYLWCIVSSIIILLAGILVFKKYQDRFVLNM